MASKRKELCVNEKVSLIRAIEKGERKIDVGRRLGLPPSTVATIWKNKEKFLQAEMKGKSPIRLRKPKFEHLDQAVLLWFNNERQNNVISRPIIKTMAEKFAKQLGITDFKASKGWLEKFKHRHNIAFSKINRGPCEDLKTDESKDLDKATSLSSTDEDINDLESKSMETDLDQTMLSWLNNHRQNSVPIPKPILILKPEKFNKQIGITDLKDWIGKFKHHHINQGPCEDLQPDENKDEDLATTASLTDEDIFDSVLTSTEKRSENEDGQVNNSEPPPSIQQALDAVKLLEFFLLFNKDNLPRSQDKIKCEKNTGIAIKQTKLTDYIYYYKKT